MKQNECFSLPCEIAQDLLPSYADGLTSEATTAAVKAHLEHCEICRAAFESMQAHVEPPVCAVAESVDHGGTDFLKKTKQKAAHKIIVAAVAAVFLCFSLFLTLNAMQHPFTPSFETYQLADGRLYFEMTVYGKEASIETISFHREMLSNDRATHDIQMGYTLLNFLLANNTYKSKTYCFPPLRIDDGLETLQYSCDKTIYPIWQNDHVVPAASAEIERQVKENETSIFWCRYELA